MQTDRWNRQVGNDSQFNVSGLEIIKEESSQPLDLDVIPELGKKQKKTSVPPVRLPTLYSSKSGKVDIRFDNSSTLYKEVDNEQLEPRTLYESFEKAGHYIIYLGWISFLGDVIIDMLVYLYVYSLQFDIWYQYNTRNGHKPGFFDSNLFLILLISKDIGQVAFSNWISALACIYPIVPFIL